MNTHQHRSPRWTLALTSIAFFMIALDALVVATALPAIRHDLHTGVATLGWTVNIYSLTYAVGIITAAALGDRLGRRRVFIAGLGLFSLASAACALAPNISLLLAARALQGLGAAAIMPLSLTLLTAAFPAERRGAVVGIWGAIGGTAVASGPVLGGALTQGLDWHWIFWINVPIGAAAILCTRLRIAEGFGQRKPVDLAGMALMTAASLGLVWALVRSGDAGWGSTEVLASGGAGLAPLIGFARWERRAVAPLLPLRLFAHRSFTAANAAAFLQTGAIMAAAFLMAQYFQLALGDSPLSTGLRLLPWTATPMVVAPMAGALSDRIGPRPLMVAGLALQAAGLGWFALLASGAPSYGAMVAPLLMAGVGISMAIPTTAAAALSAVGAADLGKASGVNSTLQRFGGVFGVALAAAVFSAHGHLGTTASFQAGFQPALGAAAGLSLLSAVAALGVVRVARAAPAPALAASAAA